ncbi:DUF4245 domain-containing protein [Nocardiopsis ansamitocini]|uniref:DUF4245 domain-containing protein n=1 Tax=Nocardiopsis ansamitocini TaxID=1670832 RepID=A0A9W6P419_9ACTN|nr:DUF4245 domain-containing protein [Nocardiopsis ansamitocini]GLU46830.1 hypothetical protein Nans01_11810 [Nocardiopsis ansamitocini]
MSSGGSRANSTFTGYAIVLGVIVLIVGAMAFVVNGRSVEHIPSIDYTADALTLAEVAPYRTYAPRDLPDGWVPTSSRLETGGALPGEDPKEPVSWSLGFATPRDRHAAFSISDADPATFIAETSRGGTPDGESTVNGEEWERYYSKSEGERAIVRRAEGATRVVSGSSQYDELEVLAQSLAAQQKPE